MANGRRDLVGGTIATATMTALVRPRVSGAQYANPVLRIGVLTDLSGPYRDTAGPGSVACTRQAAEEAQAASPGLRVDVLQADHQNKPEVGAALVCQWFDRDGVDAVVDVPNSAVGLAVAEVAREKDKVFLVSGAVTADLTGPRCAPTTVHWAADTYMLAWSNGGALVKAGRTSWFFLTADYAFGHALQRDATAFIDAAGGRVVGSVRYPFPQTTDFSAFLVSGAVTADLTGTRCAPTTVHWAADTYMLARLCWRGRMAGACEGAP
ncbi:MAG: ABC transporter substrate-binding protein, partial [Acetobacteraceae bacterium]|nr:ABC transporter substrate-binding protein [Acetobacteraceae bacterium]